MLGVVHVGSRISIHEAAFQGALNKNRELPSGGGDGFRLARAKGPADGRTRRAPWECGPDSWRRVGRWRRRDSRTAACGSSKAGRPRFCSAAPLGRIGRHCATNRYRSAGRPSKKPVSHLVTIRLVNAARNVGTGRLRCESRRCSHPQ